VGRGVPLAKLGEPLTEIVTFPLPQPQTLPNGDVESHVLHIDHFGNLILDIKEGDRILSGGFVMEVADRRIQGLRRAFADVPIGELVAYIGSSGHLEIALREGNAAQLLGMELGDSILLREIGKSEGKG
jgi:S-adenosylmethionine hydrolase